MLMIKGYTLIEILVVLVVIGTLVALAWPNYLKIKEKNLNREAQADLLLIRVAEKEYRMEHGFYYPELAITSVIADINSFLRLRLPANVNASWAFLIDDTTVPEFAKATRTGFGTDGRYWKINFSGDSASTCSGGTDCPP